MRTDIELLKRAAKAADLPPDGTEIDEGGPMSKGGLIFYGNGTCIDWNPLSDDGDALRLAVKLRIPLWFDDHATICNQRKCGDTGYRVETGIYDLGGYTATRRAIVLSAAEMVK